MTTAADICEPPSGASTQSPLRITVLLGGPSAEREVSLNSGKAVAAALNRLGHLVTCCDISPTDLSALDRPADLVFIALHGTFGEDGQLQAILSQRELPFVGSGSEASRLAMHKADSKEKFLEAGIPTPAFKVVTRNTINGVLGSWQLPTIIKPVNEGSSVDITIARDAFTFQSTVEQLLNKYGECLIEEYIKGPELTVGIIGDKALPVCEIRTPREFYDYEAKYTADSTEYLFDFDLPQALLREVQQLSLEAHRVLGCRDFSRVDWMIDAVDLHPYVLEVNTIPGFTDHSLLPKAAARDNLSFDHLCRQILSLAWDRARAPSSALPTGSAT